MMWFDLTNMIFLAIIFVISISLHEYAHAWTSWKLGDPTPKIQWRLTPNPLVHIDPIGFICIFLINFGWWRPVIINPNYYKNPIKDELLVSLAWPITNIILSIVGTVILLLYVKFSGWLTYFDNSDLIVQFWFMFSWINIALAVFNMIPLPPLDWYRIVKFLYPPAWYRLEKNMRIIAIILLAALLLPTPLRGIIGWTISSIAQVIYGVIHGFLTLMLW